RAGRELQVDGRVARGANRGCAAALEPLDARGQGGDPLDGLRVLDVCAQIGQALLQPRDQAVGRVDLPLEVLNLHVLAEDRSECRQPTDSFLDVRLRDAEHEYGVAGRARGVDAHTLLVAAEG